MSSQPDVLERSPAQVYGLVFGAFLVALGVVGFFYSASFETGADLPRDAVLGVIDVNGWLNALHAATGAVALAAASSRRPARAVALALGLLYVAVPVVGFATGDKAEIVGLIPSDTWNDIVHLMVGVAGIAAWQSSD